MAAPEIPKKQKAAIYDQPGKVSTKIVELDVPEPGAGEILINLYVLSLLPTLKEVSADVSELTPAYATLTWVS